MSGLDGLASMRQDIENRVRTDRIISTIWLLVPALTLGLLLADFAYFFLGFFLAGSNPGAPLPSSLFRVILFSLGIEFLGLIAEFLQLLLVYRFVNRRDQHFQRQKVLFANLIGYLLHVANGKNLYQDFQMKLGPVRQTLSEINTKETNRDATLWVILSFFVPFASLYVDYFLMKDIYRHERREEAFLQELSTAATVIGVNLGFQPRAKPTPNRSFLVYFLLTIFTVGVFWFYWLYRLITDPNRHFTSQWAIEDSIFRDLQETVPTQTP